jgi:integrase/recombinase XerD
MNPDCKADTRTLSRAEFERLLGEINTRYYSPHRDSLMFRVMWQTGMRPNEVCDLTEKDLDFATGEVAVRDDKNGNDRDLWLKSQLCEDLRSWCRRRTDSAYLFPTSKGTRVQESHLRQSIKRYYEKAGLGQQGQISLYSFRHTFATRLYRSSGIAVVMEALGHQEASCTMRYIHVDEPTNGDLRSALQ